MNDHQLQQSIDRVVQRVHQLGEQIRAETDPGISVVLELMSAREIFVGMLERQPDCEDCQKQINEIDELMRIQEDEVGCGQPESRT